MSDDTRAHAKRLRMAQHEMYERSGDCGTAKREYDTLCESLIDDLLDNEPADLKARVRAVRAARKKWRDVQEAMFDAQEKVEAIESEEVE